MRRVAVLILLALSGACAHAERSNLPNLAPVSQVDLSRYAGTWYEIASFPQRFQKGCQATQAIYSLNNDGTIEVLNRCHKDTLDGPISEIHGRARRDDSGVAGALEVQFFWPFWAHYWVIELDPSYRWAVVSHPSGDYLWILSRTPQMDSEVYGEIVKHQAARGLDVSRLRKTLQPERSGATL